MKKNDILNINLIWGSFINKVHQSFDIMNPSFYEDASINKCERFTLNKVITTEADLARKFSCYIEAFLINNKLDLIYSVHQELFVEKGNKHVDISIHKTDSIKYFCSRSSVIQTAKVLIEVKYLPQKNPSLKISNTKNISDSAEHDFEKLFNIKTSAEKYTLIFAEYLTGIDKINISKNISKLEIQYHPVKCLSNF